MINDHRRIALTILHMRLGSLVLLVGIASQAQAGSTTYDYTGSLQDYTVATTGIYSLTASGATGGAAYNGNTLAASGGSGATLSGDYLLTAGTVLEIVVGGQGANTGEYSQGAGGGGGTFIYFDTSSQLLMAAGGGGGASSNGARDGSAGLTGTSGGNGLSPVIGAGSDVGTGGTSGNGGSGGSNFEGFNSGGGAGWLTAGGNGPGSPRDSGAGGASFPTFAGGAYVDNNFNDYVSGGYGGGGGGGASEGGGGGGGYSGGGGGGSVGGGGGGGSYFDSAFTNTTAMSGANSGDGIVTISLVSNAAVPEPSTWIMLAVGMTGVAIARRRRQVAAR